MAYEIRISDRASREIDKIFDYLLNNWSEQIASEFINKLNSKLKIISEYPFIYSQSSFGKKVRRCVVTKQTSLYYKLMNKRISIIYIFDSRQSSDKIKM